ncbi:hypothetical protein BDZ89DRAFT_129173 [Hymenopellis radicata]|nr:hypothetical protein BDZ89DRAFT_129173 [Hymenopellis radicata]
MPASSAGSFILTCHVVGGLSTSLMQHHYTSPVSKSIPSDPLPHHHHHCPLSATPIMAILLSATIAPQRCDRSLYSLYPVPHRIAASWLPETRDSAEVYNTT